MRGYYLTMNDFRHLVKEKPCPLMLDANDFATTSAPTGLRRWVN